MPSLRDLQNHASDGEIDRDTYAPNMFSANGDAAYLMGFASPKKQKIGPRGFSVNHQGLVDLFKDYQDGEDEGWVLLVDREERVVAAFPIEDVAWWLDYEPICGKDGTLYYWVRLDGQLDMRKRKKKTRVRESLL